MIETNYKCPNCSANLEPADKRGLWRCPYCESTFRHDDPEAQAYADEEAEEEETEGIELTDEVLEQIAEMVRDLCVEHDLHSTYVVSGRSVLNDRKFAKAKKNFGIEDDEDCYLVFDSTLFGSCRTGFALCTSGIYFACEGGPTYDEGHPGYISWGDFYECTVELDESNGRLYIDDDWFVAAGDGDELYALMEAIIEALPE